FANRSHPEKQCPHEHTNTTKPEVISFGRNRQSYTTHCGATQSKLSFLVPRGNKIASQRTGHGAKKPVCDIAFIRRLSSHCSYVGFTLLARRCRHPHTIHGLAAICDLSVNTPIWVCFPVKQCHGRPGRPTRDHCVVYGAVLLARIWCSDIRQSHRQFSRRKTLVRTSI